MTRGGRILGIGESINTQIGDRDTWQTRTRERNVNLCYDGSYTKL